MPRRPSTSAVGDPVASRSDPDSQLAGQLLIAMPGIEDPRFERAVVLTCVHNDEHAMGLALNRPVGGLTVPGLLAKLGVESSITLAEDDVLIGGPVQRERGFVIHTDDYTASDSTLPVVGGLALTATREVLAAMADAERRPRRSMLALGYAGWGAGQLEDEIRQGVWLTATPDYDLIFDQDHETKWKRALALLGVRPDQLVAATGKA